MLDDVLSRVTVLKGKPGRWTKEQTRSRLLFDWKPDESWPVASGEFDARHQDLAAGHRGFR